MVVKTSMNMRTARIRAMRARSRGFKATIFRVKGESRPRISVTRNIKRRR